MALIKCSECGNEVSDSAAACPKCGAPVRKKKGIGCIASAGIIVGAIVIFSVAFSDKDTSSQDRSPTPASATGNATPSSAASGNPAHDQLLALSTSQRNTVLARLIRSADEACPAITRSFYQGLDKDHDAFWNVACDTGHSYSVMISSNSTGSTKVTDCAVLKMVGVECWRKF